MPIQTSRVRRFCLWALRLLGIDTAVIRKSDDLVEQTRLSRSEHRSLFQVKPKPKTEPEPEQKPVANGT